MPYNKDDLTETSIFLKLKGFLYICLEDCIYNRIFNLEESRIKINEKIQIKKVNERVDNNKLVNFKRNSINIKIKFILFLKK